MALHNLAAQVQKPASPAQFAQPGQTVGAPRSAVVSDIAIHTAQAKAGHEMANVTNPTPASAATLSPIAAMTGQPMTDQAKASQIKVGSDAKQEHALKQQIANEMQNPVKREIPLTWTQQQMMCALSAMQIRYGRPAEAVPYLMMVRKINPQNVEATRLLALSFMRLGRWQEADTMVEEYDHLQKSSGSGVVNGLVLLYRSLVSFKTSRISDAKAWFGKFRQFNKVS